jgi:hypothetical protein
MDSQRITWERVRLKHTEIKSFREQKLLEQDHRCALCGEHIDTDAVLDHDHKTGKIRSVLHRGCNAMLGKIENNMARNRLSLTRLNTFAQNLVTYMEHNYADIVHPTHLTKEERRMKAYKKKGGGGKKK